MQKIINALNNSGLQIRDLLVDGRIHRCHSSAKKKKNKDGWYVVNKFQGNLFCYFGCWITVEKNRVSSLESMSRKDWKKIWEKTKMNEKDSINNAHKKASEMLNKCIPANNDHPYLQKKKIEAHGILQFGTMLIIPIQNCADEIVSYQLINRLGEKRFMPTGILKGCYHIIKGTTGNKQICICEGFATGASINEATGYTVVVAMSASNMAEVSNHFSKKSEIILCCDNDSTKKDNIGIETGKTIKQKINCEMVFPEGIEGSDFNDLASEKGLEFVADTIKKSVKIVTIKTEEDDGLIIPPEAIPIGLIHDGVEALGSTIMQYTLPLVLTVISRAIAGKISLDEEYPNIFNIKVGSTSTGKSYVDKLFKKNINISGFVGMTDIASGPALLRGLQSIPTGMGIFDEVTSIFKRYSEKDPVQDGKLTALLEVYSASGSFIRKSYSDSKNTIVINNPCFSMIGNATPIIFQDISSQDFETGLMQRFSFWKYNGGLQKHPKIDEKKINRFIEKLAALMENVAPISLLARSLGSCYKLTPTSSAVERLESYSDHVISVVNKKKSDGEKGIISRKYELMLKYAMIHHAACSVSLYSELQIASVEYGILIAEMLIEWKLNHLNKYIVSGAFHANCEIFKASIVASLRSGRKNPTFKFMCSRKIQMKNWNQKYSESVINVLTVRREIITKELAGITRYYLVKN